MSPRLAPPNWRALRIWSAVWPAAPFIVMPRANEALSGEMKTLESRWAALTFCQRAKAKALAASRTIVSRAASGRGRVAGAVGSLPGALPEFGADG